MSTAVTSTAAPASTRGREPQLRGQTVVVIGGSSGMGLETARQARAEGAELILAARNEERLAAAATEVGARSWKSFDATDAESLKQFFDGLGEPIDHVMASGWRPGRRPGVPFRPAEAGVIAKRARCTLQVPNPGPPAR